MTQPTDVVDPGPAPSPDVPITEVPPAWTSTSFWVTMVPVISAVLGFFLHKQIDLSGMAAAIGLIAASVATGALALARALHHSAVIAANTAAQGLRLEHLRWTQERAQDAEKASLKTQLDAAHAELRSLKSPARKRAAAGVRR